MRTRLRVLLGVSFGGLLVTGCIWLLVSCGQPNFATDAQVLAVLSQPRTPAETQALAATGKTLFTRHSCSNCHAVAGPTHGAPLLTNLYVTQAKLRDGTTFSRSREYLVASILRPQEVIVTGYSQQMSNYRFLPAEDVAALVTYLESLTPPAPTLTTPVTRTTTNTTDTNTTNATP